MYKKLKGLSIEELEVEIEDLDMYINMLKEDMIDIDRKISDLTEDRKILENKITGYRALSKLCSDLILEKQKEETH